RLRTPRARHRQPLALRRLGTVPPRAHHRRQPPRSAPAPQHRRRHRRRVLPHARSPNPRRSHPTKDTMNARGVGTFSWPPAGTTTWPLTSPLIRIESRSTLLRYFELGGSRPIRPSSWNDRRTFVDWSSIGPVYAATNAGNA